MADRSFSKLMRRAESCLKEKRVKEALKLFDQAAKSRDKDPRPWRAKGMALEEVSKFKKAVSAFDRALELDPEDVATRESRDAAFRKAELMKKATLMTLGLKRVNRKEKEKIFQLKAEQKARKKAAKLRQQGLALEKRAQKYRSTDKAKAKNFYLKSAVNFREAAAELMPEQHKQRGVELETFWAVFPASDGVVENFDYYIEMLRMARAWERLGRVYEAKDRKMAGDMFMRAAEDKAHLADLRRRFKYTDEQILLYRSATWEKAEEMYKEAIGVERKIEFGDELEQKRKEARQKRERAEKAIANLAKRK